MELLMGLEFRLVLLPFFFIFLAHFPLSIPLSPFPPSRSPLPTPVSVTSVEQLWIYSNPHLSFKLPVKSKKNKNHQNVMSTKKFQFVVVVNSSVLLHRLPVYTTGKKIDITVQTRTVKLS